jgi:hypothetical protein
VAVVFARIDLYLSTRKLELFPQDKDASVLLQKKMKEEQGITIFYKDKVKKIEKKTAMEQRKAVTIRMLPITTMMMIIIMMIV